MCVYVHVCVYVCMYIYIIYIIYIMYIQNYSENYKIIACYSDLIIGQNKCV